MKRRTFLKTVGSVAGAAVLGPGATAQQPLNSKGTKTKRKQAGTYALGDTGPATDPADPTSPFKTLPIRKPGWFPDGADWGGTTDQPLFQEEVVGIKKDTAGNDHIFPFGIPFPAINSNNEFSKNWALGHKLKQVNEMPGHLDFTAFVRRLALRARQYNATLYRLRRLHFYWHYQNAAAGSVQWPEHNPNDGKETTAPDPKGASTDFAARVCAAEKDWMQVTDQLNGLLENAKDSSVDCKCGPLAADMVTVNGYIISMRIVIKLPGKEPGGSSSQVSISSPFSSSSQKPYP
jgi:hypothetical protein